MGIDLEEIIEMLEEFEESMLYFLTCKGRRDQDQQMWVDKINLLKDQIIQTYGPNKDFL
jgi:hypothetical protein